MAIKDLPKDYTVAFIDGVWYPIQISRLYSAQHPDGCIILYQMGETFRTQREAIEFCQNSAEITEHLDRYDWERLAAGTDGYPDRCDYYVNTIKQYCGHEPIVTRGSRDVLVFVPASYCSVCKTWVTPVAEDALFIEDALASAAESAYACRCQCERAQEEYLSQVTRGEEKELCTTLSLS